MTLPKESARLPPFPVKIDKEKWDVATNRGFSQVQFAFKEVKISEATDDLSNTGIVEPSDAKHYRQVVLAPKPKTTSLDWRFCIDHREIYAALPNKSHIFY